MTLPSLSISVCSRTVPSIRACRASCGYTGCTLLIADAIITSPPRETLVTTAAGGGGGGGGAAVLTPPIIPPSTPPICPPGTPPTTPPVTVVAAPRSGGGASSLIIFTSFGIDFGAINLPASIKCAMGFTCTTGAAGGGGGGAAGGGGAVNIVARKLLGSAGVTSRGIISIRASSPT